MATKKQTKGQTFRFSLQIQGTLTAKTLEEAEEKLDHAFNTQTLKQRGVVITGRDTYAHQSTSPTPWVRKRREGMTERLSDERVREIAAVFTKNNGRHLFDSIGAVYGSYGVLADGIGTDDAAALANEVLELRQQVKDAPKVTPLIDGLRLRTSPDIEAGALWANPDWLADQTDTRRFDALVNEWVRITSLAAPPPLGGEG